VQSVPSDGRKHCSQLTSCEEAEFFLANCPGVKMDRVADACHLHIHRISTAQGFNFVAEAAVGVQKNFYDVEFISYGPMAMYREDQGFAEANADGFRAFVDL
jgi:hypothetical protein